MSPPIFHEDLASVEQLRKLLIELTASYEKLLVESKAGMKALQEETQKATKVTSEHVTAVKTEKDRYTDLVEAQKKLLKSQQDNEKAVNQSITARKKQVNILMQANTVAHQEAKTIDEVRKKVSALNLLWKNSEIGTKRQKELAEQLKKTTAELKRQEQAVGIHGRNVGNYASAIKANYLAIGVAITGAIMIARKFISTISETVKLAGMQEKAEAKVANIIKQTGSAAGYTTGQLKSMASELQKNSVFGDEEILNKVSAQLLTFTNISGSAFKRAQVAAMDLSSVLDGDLQASTIMLGKALNDPITGMTAMRRVGIAFTDSQIATVKALVETNQLAKAQSLILDELAIQYGGTAKAISETGIGALEKYNAAWSDFKENIGTSIIPMLVSLTSVLQRLFASTEEKEVLDLTERIRSAKAVIAIIEEKGLPFQQANLKAQKEILQTSQDQLRILEQRKGIEEGLSAIEALRASAAVQVAKYMERLHAKQAADREEREKKAKIEAEKNEKDRIAAAKKQSEDEIKLANQRNKELFALTQKELADEVKLTDDTYKLKKELGITSYQEVYSYELEKITESAAYRKLIEGKTADEVLRIWKKASDKAKKAAQGFTVSGLPAEADEFGEMGDMPDFAGGVDINPADVLQPDAWQETFSTIAGYAQTFGGIITDVLRMISDANQREFRQQMDEAENRYTSETAYLDEQLRNKTISETQYNARKAAVEQKKASDEAKLKKEYAKKQRDLQLTQAIVNTALAVTSALTTQPFILGVILAVVAAALGAIEISTISSAQFAKGGHQKLGQAGSTLRGKSHAQGGVNLGEVGTAEAGEYMGIINRSSTRKYEQDLPLIFDSLNKQNFENVFAHPNINVNVDSTYSKKMYKEMVKGKPAVSETTIAGNMIITRTGNHTVKTYMG